MAHPTASSLTTPRLNVVNVFLTSFAFTASKTSKLNPITNIRTLLSARLEIPNASLTLSWIVPGPRLVSGYSASSMWSSFSTTWRLMLLVVLLPLKLPLGNVLTSPLSSNSGGLNLFSTLLTTPLPQTVLRNLAAGLVLLKPKGML